MEQRIRPIIRGFSERLGITQQVAVSVVASDSRLASVRHISGGVCDYQISFEAEFLRTLDDRELSAVVAHELGHVWIFTHFPYLQTETLANEAALKLVSQDDLERIYQKVRKWNSEKGSVQKIVGSAGEIDARHDTK